jgi:hypothetical protein
VYASGTGDPIAHATLSCRWAGFDDILGTADDVVLDTVANAAGEFQLTQVPYGLFSCVGHDPVTGASSASTTAWVLSAATVHTELPVADAGHLPVRHQPDVVSLADTGAATRRLLVMSVAMLLLGMGVLHLARRRLH